MKRLIVLFVLVVLVGVETAVSTPINELPASYHWQLYYGINDTYWVKIEATQTSDQEVVFSLVDGQWEGRWQMYDAHILPDDLVRWRNLRDVATWELLGYVFAPDGEISYIEPRTFEDDPQWDAYIEFLDNAKRYETIQQTYRQYLPIVVKE